MTRSAAAGVGDIGEDDGRGEPETTADDANPTHVTITIRPSVIHDIASLATAIRLELEPLRLALYPQPDRRQVQKWDSFCLEMSERVQLWVDRFCDGEFLPLYQESRKVKKFLFVSLIVTFDEGYHGDDAAAAARSTGATI